MSPWSAMSIAARAYLQRHRRYSGAVFLFLLRRKERMRSIFDRRAFLTAMLTSTAGAMLSRSTALAQSDPLSSWNDGRSKQSILDFVASVTREGSGFVPVPQRIATFDNDGTLWVEQPMYTQLAFALDRVKALAPQHPVWKKKQPFKAALEGNMETLERSGEHGLIELILATHAGMTTEEFENAVRGWLTTAQHPRFKRPYTEL